MRRRAPVVNAISALRPSPCASTTRSKCPRSPTSQRVAAKAFAGSHQRRQRARGNVMSASIAGCDAIASANVSCTSHESRALGKAARSDTARGTDRHTSPSALGRIMSTDRAGWSVTVAASGSKSTRGRVYESLRIRWTQVNVRTTSPQLSASMRETLRLSIAQLTRSAGCRTLRPPTTQPQLVPQGTNRSSR